MEELIGASNACPNCATILNRRTAGIGSRNVPCFHFVLTRRDCVVNVRRPWTEGRETRENRFEGTTRSVDGKYSCISNHRCIRSRRKCQHKRTCDALAADWFTTCGYLTLRVSNGLSSFLTSLGRSPLFVYSYFWLDPLDFFPSFRLLGSRSATVSVISINFKHGGFADSWTRGKTWPIPAIATIGHVLPLHGIRPADYQRFSTAIFEKTARRIYNVARLVTNPFLRETQTGETCRSIADGSCINAGNGAGAHRCV